MTEKNTKDQAMSIFQEWGFVDDNGNLCQKDGTFSKGRILGKVTDKDKESQIRYYVEKFDSLQNIYQEIQDEFEQNTNKKLTLEKIEKFLAYLDRAAAIGDFDTITQQTQQIQNAIVKEFNHNLELKKDICKKVAALIQSNEFTLPVSEIKQLQRDFALIGYVPAGEKEQIQEKFRALLDEYFTKRNEFKDEQEQTRHQNLEAKKALCAEAENLSTSELWQETTEHFIELQSKWKEIGEVPIDSINSIWERFKKANDTFFANRQNYYDQQDQIRQNNLKQKEKLCEQAEALQDSEDWAQTTQKLIDLQKEWKQIGPVPREENDAIWERFKKANDTFFERKTDHVIEDKNRRLDNLRIKEQLCEEAEELSELKGFDSVKEKIAELKNQWVETGPVPVGQAEEIGLRFSEACRNAMKD